MLRPFHPGLLAALALWLTTAPACATILGFDDLSQGAAGGDDAGPDGPGNDGAGDGGHDVSGDCAGKCGQLKNSAGVIVDCGGCANGLNCGGGGPNVCGTGNCTPSCSGKACGASDNCQSVCTSGSCGTGLHCIGGTCACDPSSCLGCCSNGQCLDGTNPSACGSRGQACVA